MVQIEFISGFMVGIEFFDDTNFIGTSGIIIDLGIVRIIWEF